MRTRFNHSRWWARSALVLGITTFLGAPPASADLQAHLSLFVGGGIVQGGSTLPGREGTIEVPAFSFPGFSPVSASGVVGGAQSRPVTATVTVDQATPVLAQAWADGTPIGLAVFRFYRPTFTGAEENYLNVTLTNAVVSSFTLTSPDSNDPTLVPRPTTVQVSFTYQDATLTFESPNSTTTRPWQNGQ